jgi:DNA-directed RNA polymerase subunit RPC12/RpoP
MCPAENDMACPECGCKVTYQYNDFEAEFELGSEAGYLNRCAACGAVFDLEDETEEDDGTADYGMELHYEGGY